MLVLAMFGAALLGQDAHAIDAGSWREDLRFLASELEKRHKSVFHEVSRELFARAVSVLDRDIANLDRDQVVVAFARLVAMVGDGHTRINLLHDPSIGFHRCPLELRHYQDGMFVQSARPDLGSRLAGTKVVAINDTPIDELMVAMGTVISHENDAWRNFMAPICLTSPEVMAALGTGGESDRMVFETADRSGHRTRIEIAADHDLPPPAFASDWPDFRDPAAPVPVWQRHSRAVNWFEHLAPSGVVYFQFNAVADTGGEKLADLCRRMIELIEAKQATKLVIDLRQNGGGNNDLLAPLISGVKQCQQINQKGRLFAIVGPGTFSAAMNCATRLEREVKVLFVGEPTGSSPNHYGDAESFTLPHSGITVFVATRYWRDSRPDDDRRCITPELPAAMSSADYRLGRDPALEAVIAYR